MPGSNQRKQEVLGVTGSGGSSGLPRQKGSHTFNGVVHFDPCISPNVNILI